MEKDVCPSASSRLTVDLDAVRANFAAIARRAAPARCGAVVKADAYGLGALPVAAALRREGCRTFFVAHLSEALALSAVLDPDCTVFILNGLDPDCEPLCADRGFIPVLNAPEQIERWRALAIARGRPLPAALQIDSGMSRLGIDLEHAAWLANDPGLAEQLSIRLLMTHLACADIPDHAANAAQLACFSRARALFPSVDASIANSAGVVLGSGYHLDLVRPGIALFGPAGDASTPLLPALRLDARIVQIRDVAPATGVGYGLSHVTAEPRRLATLGIGYADGWPRSLSGRGSAWFDGTRLPIIGRVSMDSMTIDISALPDDGIAAGDFVELIGPSQSPADVARDAGTIDHEILARLGSRYQRIYLESGAAHVQAAGGWQ